MYLRPLIPPRFFHTSTPCSHIQKMTRLRVVDNSALGRQAMAEGRPPKCIQVYNKTGIGTTGDRVLLAILGEKKKGVIVGVKKHQPCNIPKFDTNNVVLIDDAGSPLGTRIHVPIPHLLRTILKEKSVAKKVDYTKVIAIASRFV